LPSGNFCPNWAEKERNEHGQPMNGPTYGLTMASSPPWPSFIPRYGSSRFWKAIPEKMVEPIEDALIVHVWP
jgi:hypothetical protein